MPIYGVAMNGDGEVLNARMAPHQADDCNGLVYKATDENGQDIYLFLVSAADQGIAVVFAQEAFWENEFVALDPIWQPGSVWPDRADEGTPEEAQVQIYSPRMGRGYITCVPTHRRTDPFIDHFGEDILWAYMRNIEARMVAEVTEDIERWKEKRRREAGAKKEPVGEATGTVSIAQETRQLMLEFD